MTTSLTQLNADASVFLPGRTYNRLSPFSAPFVPFTAFEGENDSFFTFEYGCDQNFEDSFLTFEYGCDQDFIENIWTRVHEWPYATLERHSLDSYLTSEYACDQAYIDYISTRDHSTRPAATEWHSLAGGAEDDVTPQQLARQALVASLQTQQEWRDAAIIAREAPDALYSGEERAEDKDDDEWCIGDTDSAFGSASSAILSRECDTEITSPSMSASSDHGCEPSVDNLDATVTALAPIEFEPFRLHKPEPCQPTIWRVTR